MNPNLIAEIPPPLGCSIMGSTPEKDVVAAGRKELEIKLSNIPGMEKVIVLAMDEFYEASVTGDSSLFQNDFSCLGSTNHDGTVVDGVLTSPGFYTDTVHPTHLYIACWLKYFNL